MPDRACYQRRVTHREAERDGFKRLPSDGVDAPHRSKIEQPQNAVRVAEDVARMWASAVVPVVESGLMGLADRGRRQWLGVELGERLLYRLGQLGGQYALDFLAGEAPDVGVQV